MADPQSNSVSEFNVRFYPVAMSHWNVLGVGGEKVCAEVGRMGNHNSPLSATGCAAAPNVPRSQIFAVDPKYLRVSVDVRFNSSEQRSPGMLLCHDIDVTAVDEAQIRSVMSQHLSFALFGWMGELFYSYLSLLSSTWLDGSALSPAIF
jgi:hypothetical protein